MLTAATIQLFGPSHLGAVVGLIGIGLWIILSVRRDAESVQSKIGIGVLIFLCLAAYPLNLLARLLTAAPGGLDTVVPLHLCDLAAVTCGFALLYRKPLLCELSYFWGLAGTLQGLLTPNLEFSFPHPVYFSFFLHHGVIVIAALLLPIGLGWRAAPGAPKRAMIWLLAYAAAIYPLNLLLGTNFGFLAAKPDGASLLDTMPEHPYYIGILILLAGVFFWLLHLPVRKKNHADHSHGRREEQTNTL